MADQERHRQEPRGEEHSSDRGRGMPHESGVEEINPDLNRMLGRRSPVGQSESSLVSRDYQPRAGGPELIASWPLGPTPGQQEPGDIDWEINDSEFVTIQKNTLLMPYVGPFEYAKIYLGVTGHAYVEQENEDLLIRLKNRNLSGKPYETTAEVAETQKQPFVSPMVEFAPETDEYENEGRIFGGYELQAKATGGVGYIDQGTSVQLWSE